MQSADKPLTPNDLNELRRLEESLWRANTRYDLEYLDKVFAPDFKEFGRSGQIYSRQEMMVLPQSRNEIGATIPFAKFHARYLDDNIVQVTYVSETTRNGTVLRANRSSLWSRSGSGWVLRFHQGTPV